MCLMHRGLKILKMENITSITEYKYVDKTLNIVLDGEMDG